MSSAWGLDLCDMAAWNNSQVEELTLVDFEEMLVDDTKCLAWDSELDLEFND